MLRLLGFGKTRRLNRRSKSELGIAYIEALIMFSGLVFVSYNPFFSLYEAANEMYTSRLVRQAFNSMQGKEIFASAITPEGILDQRPCQRQLLYFLARAPIESHLKDKGTWALPHTGTGNFCAVYMYNAGAGTEWLEMKDDTNQFCNGADPPTGLQTLFEASTPDPTVSGTQYGIGLYYMNDVSLYTYLPVQAGYIGTDFDPASDCNNLYPY